MEIKIGLIKGRHELPVDNYVLDVVDNVLDFETIKKAVWDKLTDVTKPFVASGTGINQDDYTDVLVWKSKVHLNVYVTGLTSVTATVIAFCAYNGVALTLYHYDVASGEYVPQIVF